MPTSVRYIDSRDALEAFCDSIRSSPWIAVDTEFMREKTYYPKFCLLQIATPEEAACIDPLRIEDLGPLADRLFDPAVTKVFHSARQDLEILFHRFQAVPSPIFDTQIAAPLIGLPEQIGYANLVATLLGVTLNKEHTRTDWARRPLSVAQWEYAANDVIYLAALYTQIRQQLDGLGRTSWLSDNFAALENPGLYENPPSEAWERVGGLDKLKADQFALAVRLAAWREATAQASDLPRSWLLRDDALLEIAEKKPPSRDALQSLRGIEPRLVQRYGDALQELIQAPAERTLAPPQPRRSPKRSAKTEAVIDAMSAILRLRCIEHTINPAVVASRKDLEEALESPADARIMQGWRRELAGACIQEFLAGKRALTVADRELAIQAHE